MIFKSINQFIRFYPDQVDNSFILLTNYLKNAVRNSDRSKVLEAKKFLNLLGESISESRGIEKVIEELGDLKILPCIN